MKRCRSMAGRRKERSGESRCSPPDWIGKAMARSAVEIGASKRREFEPQIWRNRLSRRWGKPANAARVYPTETGRQRPVAKTGNFAIDDRALGSSSGGGLLSSKGRR